MFSDDDDVNDTGQVPPSLSLRDGAYVSGGAGGSGVSRDRVSSVPGVISGLMPPINVKRNVPTSWVISSNLPPLIVESENEDDESRDGRHGALAGGTSGPGDTRGAGGTRDEIIGAGGNPSAISDEPMETEDTLTTGTVLGDHFIFILFDYFLIF